jgi:predicted phosphodiesterase
LLISLARIVSNAFGMLRLVTSETRLDVLEWRLLPCPRLRNSRYNPSVHRIAILADIHGNLPAFEAVIEDIARLGVDEVLVAGDLVGRGPQGSAIVARVRGLGWPTLRGNHEGYLLDFRQGKVPRDWLSLESHEWSAARWMAAELSSEDAAWIASLPFSLRPASAGGLCLVHGTPRSENEGLGPWSSEAELAQAVSLAGEPWLVCAHTHRAMVRPLSGDRCVVNTGSVGLPFNRDRRAQYALLEHDGASWRATLRQVDYDLAAIFAVYESTGFLAAGGVTAHLLRLELENASPLLVPFLKWAEVTGVRPSLDRLDDFLRFHEPDQPLAAFFLKLESLAARLSATDSRE